MTTLCIVVARGATLANPNDPGAGSGRTEEE